ncbi:MAG TPA: TRAP transporter small permease [Azospirillaceae bacterium]|nr:TRAP transporter small permease [Azospirillaceae bacterium]
MFGRAFAHLEEGLMALLLAAMTVLTFVQVVLRYIFNTGFVWALETTTYMFGWLVLIGISYGVRVNAHIGIDFVVKALPVAGRRLVGLIAIALSFLYSGLMAWGAYKYIQRMQILGVNAEDIPVERWILAIVLPIGFALLAIRLLEVAVGILRGRRSGFELADEAAEMLREHQELAHEHGGAVDDPRASGIREPAAGGEPVKGGRA